MILPAAVLLSMMPPSGPATAGFADTPRSPAEERPALFETLIPARADRGDSDILVVVSSGLAASLAPELSRFQTDLEADGYDVTVEIMAGGTPADLRADVISHTGIAGVILVGHLPAAWFEMDEWSGQHEEFPLDLYYMDLDGFWSDTDGDGLLDQHTGERGAEVWVGRIDAHAVEYGSETELMRDFFDKNHYYRTGALAAPQRAMAFNDDDWSMYGDCGLASIYPSVDVYQASGVTTAAYYRDRLEYGYEFVHLMSHSSPWGHTFKSGGGYSGTVTAPEIAEINPPTVFVQLFACSNCRWTEPNCLGNWYLFGEDHCLLAVGSTKTGSMLEFEEFYLPLGAGTPPGPAFRDWMNEVGIGDPAWHYGCVLLGDPTIRPMGSGAAAALPQGHGQTPDATCIQVSTSQHSDCYPSTATSGEDVWIAWTTGGTSRLDIAARHCEGGSWSPVMIIEQDEYWDVQPSLAVDGTGQPWLAWASFSESSYGYDIRLAHGDGFQTVSTAVDGDGYDVDPVLAWGGRIWLAWQTWRRGEGDIMVKSVSPAFPETYLSADGSEDFSPAAAADPSGSLHVAWVSADAEGEVIMWTRGGAGGFQAPQEISSGSFCRAPALGLAGGQLVLAWQQDDSGSSIRARVWNGSAWGPEQILCEQDQAACMPSVGASPEGAPVVAWQHGSGSAAELRASTLTASGWTAPAALVTFDGPAWTPSLGDGVIAWAGNGPSGNWDIWAVLDGGLGVPGQQPGFSARLSANPVAGSSAVLLLEGAPGPVEAAVYDLTGRRVASATALQSEASALLDVSGLPSGAYRIRVLSAGAERSLGMVLLSR